MSAVGWTETLKPTTGSATWNAVAGSESNVGPAGVLAEAGHARPARRGSSNVLFVCARRPPDGPVLLTVNDPR